MQSRTLSAVFEQEHRDIDDAVEHVADTAVVTAADRTGLARAVALLRRHIYAEEELLFPGLREAGLFGPVLVMLREHAEIWETLDTLDRVITGGDPDGGALAWTCRQLLAQLQAHNSKEETILYPQADAVLDADTAARLHSFLTDEQPPPGWTCRYLQPRAGGSPGMEPR
jgi:iron-sulfur cluster repair protein YtfE (RIC family)